MCIASELVMLERTKEGKIVVNAPAGGSSSKRNVEVVFQLTAWAKKHPKRGGVFGPDSGFFLPDGAMLGPDAAFVTAEQMRALTAEEKEHFFHLTPVFVIEVLSPSDSLRALKEKMEEWIANGAQLGWLIDPYERNVLIYEPGKKPFAATNDKVTGTGPVEGFVLDLKAVWDLYED